MLECIAGLEMQELMYFNHFNKVKLTKHMKSAIKVRNRTLAHFEHCVLVHQRNNKRCETMDTTRNKQMP